MESAFQIRPMATGTHSLSSRSGPNTTGILPQESANEYRVMKELRQQGIGIPGFTSSFAEAVELLHCILLHRGQICQEYQRSEFITRADILREASSADTDARHLKTQLA
jgi:hypothetical protein